MGAVFMVIHIRVQASKLFSKIVLTQAGWHHIIGVAPE